MVEKKPNKKLKETQTFIVKNLLNKNISNLEIMDITNISIILKKN